MEHDLPLAQEHDLVKDLLDVGDQVRGDDDRCVLAVVADDRAQDVVARRGVHTADGLVKEIELGVAAHRQDELRLLAHALGERLDLLRAVKAEVHQHRFGHAAAEVRIKVAVVVERLRDRHPAGQRVSVGQVRDDGLRCAAGGLACNQNFARRRRQKAVGELDERRLAAAVGAEQAHDAPGFDREIDAVEHRFGAVIFRERLAFKNTHSSSSLAP